MDRSVLTIAAILVAVFGVDDGIAANPVRRARQNVTPPPAEAAPVAAPAAGSASGMVPRDVKLRPTTPAETEANAIWSTRAALNIAALQCQFSPFLATVRNYNDFLRQHADELDRARATMVGHFKRYDASQAQNSFDRYTTQTYNSYSTLDAQYAFCEEAGMAGRTALTVRKGELGRQSIVLRDRMRASLVPVAALALIRPVTITPVALPSLD